MEEELRLIRDGVRFYAAQGLDEGWLVISDAPCGPILLVADDLSPEERAEAVAAMRDECQRQQR